MMRLATKISDHPLILFDGVCNLCNASVQVVIKWDNQKMFRFASLQSGLGQSLLRDLDSNTLDLDTVVLIHRQVVYLKSDAVLEMFKLIGGWRKLLVVFKVFPRGLRDWVYEWIANHRYSWFGKRSECMVPTPELEDRFFG